MKNISLIIVFVSLVNICFPQSIGINSTGATPASSAMLDISSSDKGVLIPRVNIVDLTTATPITGAVTSLLVYNTNTTSGVGYYYWDGTKWTQLLDANATTDDQDWYKETTTVAPSLITDDIYTEGKVRISTPNYPPLMVERTSTVTNGIAGIIRAKKSTTVDMIDGFGVRLDFAIEDNAGVDNEIAHIGAVRDGADNSGKLQIWTENVGVDGVKMVVTPSGKVGIGLLVPSRGRLEVHHDVSEEYSARLFNSQDASGNLLLLESNGGSDDDTLIYAVGDINGTPSDKFILLGDGRVGVNQSNPNAITKLDVNGYYIGKVFSFSAYSSNNVANYSNGSISYSEVEDNHNNYDGTIYTAPVDGLYYFSTNITFDGGSGSDDTQYLRFLKNGTTPINSLFIDPLFYSRTGDEYPVSNSCLIRLSAGETVEVNIADVQVATTDYSTRSFMGYFVSK